VTWLLVFLLLTAISAHVSQLDLTSIVTVVLGEECLVLVNFREFDIYEVVSVIKQDIWLLEEASAGNEAGKETSSYGKTD
jgi:hypothetical protein